jgi:hypothetical protein
VDMPGIHDGVIPSLALDRQNNLYACGQFWRTADDFIARWDGSSWNFMGSVIANDSIRSSYVQSLSFDDSGIPYAGGYYYDAYNIDFVAKWDGKAWKKLGNGINGHITVVKAIDSENVYAAGEFDSAGGISCKHVAKWNGRSWIPLGNGITIDSLKSWNFPNSLAFDKSGNLFVGCANALYKWDGAQWNTLGWGRYFRLIADKSGNIYCGGGGGLADHPFGVARWNGAAWDSIGPGKGPEDHVFFLAIDGSGMLYAVWSASGESQFSYYYITYLENDLWNVFGIVSMAPTACVVDNSGNFFISGGFPQVRSTIYKSIPINYEGIARCVLTPVSVNSQKHQIDKLSVSPKIIGGRLSFSLEHGTNASFAIVDLNGRLMVRSGQLSLNSGKHAMDLGALPCGIYILNFHAGNISFNSKFSVTRKPAR